MSRARLIITAITTQGLSQAEAARTYGVSEATVSRYMARWRSEGETAFEPRSRASPTATSPERVELVLALRKQLIEAGLDAGAETIGWHLEHHHQAVVSRATILDTASSRPNRRNVPSRPTSDSKPRCRTRPGSPISRTTDSPPVPTSRS
ncbi:helix-turn-helix domain-containing protein [Aeromicrobium camelliae]|uniref:helix-turn-helix domain-containing protein n=1 Tax=Aeromicrobium camelliae TaxID=1538144 RepID=UPI001AA049F8